MKEEGKIAEFRIIEVLRFNVSDRLTCFLVREGRGRVRDQVRRKGGQRPKREVSRAFIVVYSHLIRVLDVEVEALLELRDILVTTEGGNVVMRIHSELNFYLRRISERHLSALRRLRLHRERVGVEIRNVERRAAFGAVLAEIEEKLDATVDANICSSTIGVQISGIEAAKFAAVN